MKTFSNMLEVYKLLNNSNCKKCGDKTCMAFAAAVFMGKKELSECPDLSREVTVEFATQRGRVDNMEEESQRAIQELKTKLSQLSFKETADRIGAAYKENRLFFEIMGKQISIDQEANLYTDIHVNPWILAPILHYVVLCKGVPVTSTWLPLRELPGGQDWYRLFGQQCEKILKKTADNYPDLFSDLVEMFSGKETASQFQSDVAVILKPLPLIPILICYWRPEDGLESSLNLFFDSSGADNLGMEGLYSLGVGIARMLEVLALQHGGH